MEKAVEEKLEAGIRPRAQPAGEGRAGADRSLAPIVRHDEQGEPPADVRPEPRDQPVDLAFEARRDVVDRGEEAAHPR